MLEDFFRGLGEGPKPQFELTKLEGVNCVFIDYKNKIVKVEWRGVVSLQQASAIYQVVIGHLETGDCNKVLINRLNLDHFSSKAKDWMRNYLLDNRFKFEFELTRMATLNHEKLHSNTFSNFMSKAMQVIFPEIKIANFESEEAAFEWLV